jgi:hypothetical protein
MRKIIFLEKSLREADNYRKKYSLYFCELYSDTGIWSEDQIIAQYLAEADKRHAEIISTITSRLS